LTNLSPLLPVIQSLKFQLHQSTLCNNTALVANLLHDDFEEMSRLGQCFDKQQTVDALKLESGYPQIFQAFKYAVHPVCWQRRIDFNDQTFTYSLVNNTQRSESLTAIQGIISGSVFLILRLRFRPNR